MQLSVSERKRADIARAALTLFARDGYERTSVDAIAAEAGVSKRTVYSHYGDKESLFLLVIADMYEQMRERFAEIMGRMTGEVTDAEKSLIATIREAVAEVSHSPERALLLRLVIAEMPHMPALLELWRNRGITPILTGLVTRLAAAGLLSADDPEQAAGHLSALTFGQINSRSMMGTILLEQAETDQIVTGGVHVFMCAYGVSRPAQELDGIFVLNGRKWARNVHFISAGH
jgi:TetR/AcrR family transcriptional regulator, mexJK operon transcriptional repressor